MQGDVSDLKNDPECSVMRQLVNLFFAKCFYKNVPGSTPYQKFRDKHILHGNLGNGKLKNIKSI